MSKEKRIHDLLQNPNYRRADEDPDFLREDAARRLRLQDKELFTYAEGAQEI